MATKGGASLTSGNPYASASTFTASSSDYELDLGKPTDGISAIRFHRNPQHPNLLLLSSWDSVSHWNGSKVFHRSLFLRFCRA